MSNQVVNNETAHFQFNASFLETFNTLIRLYDKDCDLNSCVECVFRDTHTIGTCPVKIIGDCSIVE